MAMALLAWIVAIPLLGGLTGLRSMMPMAVLCLFAWRGHMEIHRSWAFWTANGITAGVFAVLALGELIGDKLPATPSRTAPFPLFARVIFGGLVGAISATALHGSIIEGTVLGAIAAIAGSFLGFHVRQMLVHEQGMKDLHVAIAEDVLTIGLSFIAMGIITG